MKHVIEDLKYAVEAGLLSQDEAKAVFRKWLEQNGLPALQLPPVEPAQPEQPAQPAEQPAQ